MHQTPESFLTVTLQEKLACALPGIHMKQPEEFVTHVRRQNSCKLAPVAVLVCLFAVLAMLVTCYSAFVKRVRPASLWRRLAGGYGHGNGDDRASQINLCSDDDQDHGVLEEGEEALGETEEEGNEKMTSSAVSSRTPQSGDARAPSRGLSQASEKGREAGAPGSRWQHAAAAHRVFSLLHLAWLQKLHRSASASVSSEGPAMAPLIGLSKPYASTGTSPSGLPVLFRALPVPPYSGTSSASTHSRLHLRGRSRCSRIVGSTSDGPQQAISVPVASARQKAQVTPLWLRTGLKRRRQHDKCEFAHQQKKQKEEQGVTIASKHFGVSEVGKGAEKAAAAHSSPPPHLPQGPSVDIDLLSIPSTSKEHSRATFSVPQQVLPVSSESALAFKRLQAKTIIWAGGFTPCRIDDYRLPEAAPPDPYHEHAFYSLPIWGGGEVKKTFDYKTLFDGRGPQTGIWALRRVRSLLARRVLSEANAGELIENVELAARYLVINQRGSLEGLQPKKAVLYLGRRFMFLEALFTAIQVLGELSQSQKWWIPLLTSIPTYYNRQFSSHVNANPVNWVLSLRLSQALEKLKSGKRPDAKTTINLKEALLCKAYSPDEFRKAVWDPWRSCRKPSDGGGK